MRILSFDNSIIFNFGEKKNTEMYENCNQRNCLILGFFALTFLTGILAYSSHVVYKCEVMDLPWTPLCTKSSDNERECNYTYNADNNKCENATSVNIRDHWKCKTGWGAICTHEARLEMDPEAFCIAHFGHGSYCDVTKRCEVASIKVSKDEL